MNAIPFDSLSYAKKLEAVGFTREQAETQAESCQEHIDAQNALLKMILEKQEKELATRTDLKELELRLQAEIKDTELRLQADIKALELKLTDTEKRLQAEIKESEISLRKEMEKNKFLLIRWQIGGWVALAAIMAKGFGWLGF